MDDVNTNSPDIIINKVLQILQTDKPVYIDIIHCITNDYIEYKIQDVGQANINDMTNGNIKNNSDMINIINRYIANLIKGPFDEKLVIRLIVNVDTAHNIALKHIQFIENPVDINNCQGGFSLYKLSLQQVNENKRVAREEAARQLADEKQRIVQEDAARLLAAEEARLAGEKQRLADEETARQLAAAEEARLAAEKQRLADEETARQLAAAKAAEEAQLAAEKQRLADEETARQLAAAKAAEEARLAGEKQRLADEETARQLAAAKAAEEARLAAEKQRLADEETARQLAAAKAAEEARLAAEKQRLVDEETARQLAAAKAAEEARLAAEKQRFADEETARQLAAAKATEEAQLAAEKQRLADEETARQLAAAKAAEEAQLAAEKQRLADEETARQLAAAEEAHKQSEEEENNWKDVEDTLISDFQTILYRIYEHLISIKTGINTKTDINSIITHLNVINGSYKSLNENFYENKNVIRNWQTQSNKVDNTDLIQETLMDFGEILPNYTANPNEKKSYPDIRLIISLQELIYKLMQYFGMDKPETPFVKKLIEAKTLLLKDAVKASAATHTDHPIKINGEIVAHSVKIIDELHLYITKHVSELRTEPLLLSIADIKTISDGLKQLIYHLQHPHGNQLDKHVSSPLVTRLDDCIKYITELITSYTTVRPIAGGKLSRKKHTKPSKQTKRRDRNRKQQTHNKRTKFRRNQTRRKSK